MNSSPCRAICPGKIILTGEHSVSHARPAVALAVGLHARADMVRDGEARVVVAFAGEPERAMDLRDLPAFADRLDQLHAEFIEGRRPIREVLSSPADLLFYAVALTRPASGLHLSVRLSIPHGSGMGSSAAVILSLLRAAMPDAPRDRLLAPALRAENLQHGRSSGVDLHTCLHGGMHLFQNGEARRLAFAPPPFLLVHTGIPASSTGECVSAVRARHAGSAIWDDFAAVSLASLRAMENADGDGWRTAIRENHRLLRAIGVVPDCVADFIHMIEAAGGAAKICGAGAVAGDRGGMVLVSGGTGLEELARERGYTILRTEMDTDGTRSV